MKGEFQDEVRDFCEMVQEKYSLIKEKYLKDDARIDDFKILNPSDKRPFFGYAINFDSLKEEYKK